MPPYRLITLRRYVVSLLLMDSLILRRLKVLRAAGGITSRAQRERSGDSFASKTSHQASIDTVIGLKQALLNGVVLVLSRNSYL